MRTKTNRQSRTVVCKNIYRDEKKPPFNMKKTFEGVSIISQVFILYWALNKILAIKWAHYILSPYNINFSSVFSFEEIKFDFFMYNWSIILPALYGLIIILVVRLVLPSSLYDNLGPESQKGLKITKRGTKLMYEDYKKSGFGKKLLVAFLLQFILVGIYLTFPKNETTLSQHLINQLLILWFIMPLLFLFLSSKRTVISILYFVFILSWSDSAMLEIFDKYKNDAPINNYEVEFEFKNTIVKSSSNLKFLCSGSISTIMLEVSPTNDTIIRKFPNEHIGEFKYSINN